MEESEGYFVTDEFLQTSALVSGVFDFIGSAMKSNLVCANRSACRPKGSLGGMIYAPLVPGFSGSLAWAAENRRSVLCLVSHNVIGWQLDERRCNLPRHRSF